MGDVSGIPSGHHKVTPYLIVKGVAEAIAFYEKAFNATEALRMPGPGGGIMHAEIMIGDSRLYMTEEALDWGNKSPLALGGTPVSLHLFFEDVDAAFAQAVEAGATPLMPPADMFWGDRFGKVVDPFGHQWSMAQHLEDLTPEEISKRGEIAMAEMCSKTKSEAEAEVAV